MVHNTIGDDLPKNPKTCYHGRLEHITAFDHHLPVNGASVPAFVCTKCGVVLFVNINVTTGNPVTLAFPLPLG